MWRSILNIVHWKDVVAKHFGDAKQFEQITRNLLFCERQGKSPSEAFGRLGVDIQDKYDLTRWYMRNSGYEVRGKMTITHGWYTAYVEKDELKFKCTIPREERNIITLPKYMDWVQSQGLDDMVDEYYNTRELVDSVVEGKSEPHKRKDIYDDEGEFIK